jgi:hypothetical protein
MHWKYKKGILICFAVISEAIAVLGSIFIIYYVFTPKTSKNLLQVNEDNNLTYLVYQKDNPFIDKPYLGPDQNYLWTYTDYLNVRNVYTADFNRKIEVSYNYLVTATVVARYNKTAGDIENPEIMKKKYLINSETATETTDNLTIKDNFDLRFKDYRALINSFIASVKLPITGEVNIDFTVDLIGKEFKSSFLRSMKIPITTEFYNVTVTGEENKKQTLNAAKKVDLWLQITLISLDLLAYVIFFILVRRIFSKKSVYRQSINDYLNRYGDLFIYSESTVDLNKYEILRVDSLKELVQIAERLFLPIIYHDTENYATFFITNHNIAYTIDLFESNISEVSL